MCTCQASTVHTSQSPHGAARDYHMHHSLEARWRVFSEMGGKHMVSLQAFDVVLQYCLLVLMACSSAKRNSTVLPGAVGSTADDHSLAIVALRAAAPHCLQWLYWQQHHVYPVSNSAVLEEVLQQRFTGGSSSADLTAV